MTNKVGSTPDNPIKLTQYRVTIWPKHGATENIYMEAPDVYTAQQYTRRVYPEHTILAIKNVLDL
jgi:hypothetical protein